MLPEVRMARIIDAIGLHQARKLSCVEAGVLLGMSERHFRRLRDAYEERGAEGIVDRRRGRMSGRRAGVDEIAWVIEEFRTRYFDFTAKHFHEAVHGRPMADGTPFSRGYTARLYVDQERAAVTWARQQGAEALGPPQEAGAPAPARHALISGRLEARLAAAGAGTRSCRDPGRRHERDALGRPGRGGGHGVEFYQSQADHCGAWIVFGPLHRPGQPLLLHAHGR